MIHTSTQTLNRSRSTGQVFGRRGVAVVEFAVTCPICLIVLMGICEISQAINGEAVMSAAVSAGCNTASHPGKTNADVIADIQSTLTSKGYSLSGVKISVLVNGSASDVANATQYSKITVTVTVPTSNVVVVDAFYFLTNKPKLSRTMSIIRHG